MERLATQIAGWLQEQLRTTGWAGCRRPSIPDRRRHGWHEHKPDVFEGCQRFFEPGYRANIIDAWIPALEDMHERLEAGGCVADVG